jgi:RNA polymerase sigma-70 factor (ECF subfamily)
MEDQMDRAAERDLVERAKRGEAEAFEAIFRAHSKMAYSVARRLIKDQDLAQEVVQDTFVDVMRKIGSFRGEAPLGAWIRRIAVNRGLMLLRSYWNKHGQLTDEETLERYHGGDDPVSIGEESDLSDALATLSPTSRTVVWLYDVEGYTHAEIASLMGKTVSFSKSQLARAHTRLREILGAYGRDEVIEDAR